METDYTHYEDWDLEDIIDKVLIPNHLEFRKKIQDSINFITSEINTTTAFKELWIQLGECFERIRDEAEMHIQKEERMVFPYIKKLIEHENPTKPNFVAFDNPLNIIEDEHDFFTNEIGRAAEIGYFLKSNLPENSRYENFFNSLNDAARVYSFHVDVETKLLYPKAKELEKGS